MRGDGNAHHMNWRFMQYKIIADEIDKNIQYSIWTTTGKVPKGPLIYPTSKRLMEKINNIEDDISCW